MAVHGIMKHAYIEVETLFTFIIRKSLMERVNQYFKDRIENFDDYYPCVKNECNLFHVHNWIQFFVSMYNDTISRRIILLRIE